MFKRVLALICACAMAFALIGCVSTGDSGENTVVGKVSSINGTQVSLDLGEITEMSMGEPPAKPEGEGSNDAPQQGEPPAKPDENGNTAQQSEPPAKPDRDGGESTPQQGEPPAKPDENGSSAQQGEPPVKPDGGSEVDQQGEAPQAPKEFKSNGETATYDLGDKMPSVLKEGDILELELDSNGQVTEVRKVEMGMPGGEFGGSGQVTQGTAATDLTEDASISSKAFSSDGDDENALRVTGATVDLKDVTVDKSRGKSSDAEDGDFYGMNAALLATDGANVTISDSTVKSNAQNGNGIFSYGKGTVVNAADCRITTKADNSGGIQTTGGATTNASNLEVDTSGNSSAAIRSDRGGGTVNVSGGSYTSNGLNSPAIYSTALISVENAKLEATNSEAIVIEGKNSVSLNGCDVTGNMSSTEGSSSSENVHNVMVYQSMSGDAEVGTASFEMVGGKLVGKSGDMFYITNTHAIMSLSGVDIVNHGDGALLRVVGNSSERGWGTAGKNGGQLELEASKQELEGDIIVDDISTLSLTLADGTSFEGCIQIPKNDKASEPVSDNVSVVIGEGCTWTLTEDSTVSALENKGTINYNGYKITLEDGTVLG